MPDLTNAPAVSALPERTYRLNSTSLIHCPGLVNYAQRAWKSDRLVAEVMLAEAFPELPYFTIVDLLSGRLETKLEDQGGTVVFTWSGPMAQPSAYVVPQPKSLRPSEVDSPEEDEETLTQ